MTCAGVLLEERTVAVFNILLVTVAHLLLTEQQESLRRDQVGALQKHTGRLQHATARQNLQQNRDTKRESENFFLRIHFPLFTLGKTSFVFFLPVLLFIPFDNWRSILQLLGREIRQMKC